MFVRNWGNRGEGSTELLGMCRVVPEPRACVLPTARILAACAQGQLPDRVQVTQFDFNCCCEEMEDVSARVSLTFSRKLHLN